MMCVYIYLRVCLTFILLRTSHSNSHPACQRTKVKTALPAADLGHEEPSIDSSANDPGGQILF